MLYCSTNTRPDIAYPVGMLCRCISCPSLELINDDQLVLCYLERTNNIGLTYSYSPDAISGHAESAYSDGSSSVGWHFQYSMAAVSWGSKKQKTVSRSSLDASIMSTSEAAKEACYLTSLIKDVGFPLDSPMKLFISDPDVLSHIYAPDHDKSRHTERRHGWIQELEDNERLTFPIVSQTRNTAHKFFTRDVKQKAFLQMRNAIMNIGSRVLIGHKERGGVTTT